MIFRALIQWWNRPVARQRILAEMSADEWRRSLDIMKAAKVGVGTYYSHIHALEQEGIVASKWEFGERDPARGHYRRRLYCLTDHGRKCVEAVRLAEGRTHD